MCREDFADYAWYAERYKDLAHTYKIADNADFTDYAWYAERYKDLVYIALIMLIMLIMLRGTMILHTQDRPCNHSISGCPF